jgi:hypothetical protein
MVVSPDVDVSKGYGLSTDGANVSWSPQIIDITPPPEQAKKISTSHQAMTETGETSRASKLKTNGPLKIKYFFKADDRPVVGATNETWTLTYPDGNTTVFEGFVLDATIDEHPLDGDMTATATIEVSGDLTNS